jgi:hypothetical protein
MMRPFSGNALIKSWACLAMEPVEDDARRNSVIVTSKHLESWISNRGINFTDPYAGLKEEIYAVTASSVAKIMLDSDMPSSMPMLAGILGISSAVPIDTVVIFERPYTTTPLPGIAPALTFAMSEQLDYPPPSVQVLAQAMSRSCGRPVDELESMFAKPIPILSKGIVMINALPTSLTAVRQCAAV